MPIGTSRRKVLACGRQVERAAVGHGVVDLVRRAPRLDPPVGAQSAIPPSRLS